MFKISKIRLYDKTYRLENCFVIRYLEEYGAKIVKPVF